jgi:ribonuclease P protein component
MSNAFKPSARLRARAEFRAVQGAGRRVPARFMTLIGRPNGLDHDRLGLIASRRVGGAVARNRAKRRLRELFRHQTDVSRPGRGLDVVAIARRELPDAPFDHLRSDFRSALARLRKSMR